MKEIILKSKKFRTLCVQILDGEFASMHDKKEFFIDNIDYAYEILKLLTEADKRGAFDHIKEDDVVEDLDSEEIIV